MTTLDQKNLSGFSFDWIIIRELRFVDSVSQDAIGVPLTGMVADVRVDTRLDDLKKSCRVVVRVTLTPSPAQHDQLQSIVTAMEGQFTVVGTNPTVAIEEFAKRQAPAIIMPFVREAVAAATGKTRFGQVLLPPINVIALMEAGERDQAMLPGTATPEPVAR